MSGDDAEHEAPTRRDCVTYGGAVAIGGLLAGCTGGGEQSTPSATGTDAATGTATVESADATAEPTETDDGSYTVELAPVGEVTFESPPESVFTRLTHHAGMAFALGRGDDVNAMHAPGYYHPLWNQFTPRLPGVSVDWEGLYSSWQPSKEKLFELDSDVHLADPAWISQQDAWSESELDEIAERVAPWFGNSLSDRHQQPPEAWADRYRYYTLWEQFAIVAEMFQEQPRYEALAAVHDDLLARIEAGLSSVDERPTAVMALPSDFDEIWVYRVNEPGFLAAHTRPFGAADAFGDDVRSGGTVDIEAMLAADPDVVLGLGGMHPTNDMAEIRANLADDPVGRELAAVENDRVYAQAARYQGPIVNLFQLEMTAKQLYPEAFGEWPRYEGGPYPELPEEEQLFDRQRVADAIKGEF